MKLTTRDITKNNLKLIRKNINQELPIFATENYLKSKSDDYGWFVTGSFILPFTIEKKLFIKRLIFTTNTIYLKKNLTTLEEKEFLNEIISYCKENDICDFIFKAQSNVVFNVYPDNCEHVEWGTYEINLNISNDEIFSNYTSKTRNMVRKAIKTDVTISTTKDIKKVYENIKNTFLRQNSILFPSLEFLYKLQKNLNNNIEFFIAEQNNIIQGSAIIIYDNSRAYYIYGGSIPRPAAGSINLMHYKIMEFFQEKNVNYYDFVGARTCTEEKSKFESLQKFKRSFGSTLRIGYAFRVIINPLKYKVFNLAVKIYFKLKKSTYIDPIDSIRRCNEQQHTNNS
jgi:hypothetical protein